MKKIIFAFTVLLFAGTAKAQNVTDALRYSVNELNGSARFRAMSGAFGALGGDLSGLSVNPAGSAVFLKSFAGATLDFETLSNETTFMNGLTSSKNSNVDFGQAGAAFVFTTSDEENNWKKFTLAFNFNKDASLDRDFTAAGVNTRSIDQYFLSHAQGVPLDLLVPLEDETVSELYSFLGENEGFSAQQAMLGYQAFIISAEDPEDFENTAYFSEVGPGSFDQEYAYVASGLNGRFAFNFASQYKDFLYLGLNLNAHFIDYERVTSFFETNNNADSSINEILFEETLRTMGNGFSFQLGTIARLGSSLRAGLAYQSPVWYNIAEETTQFLRTDSAEFGSAVVDPDVVNVYPEYKLQTPAEYTASMAYLFGNHALVSLGYSYKDYSTTRFKPQDDPAFDFQNQLMSTELGGSSTIRIGGEYRFNELSLRAGYRMQDSPYEAAGSIGDLQGYSGGIGYDFGSITIDLSYDHASRDENPRLFQTGLTDRAHVERDLSHVALSLNFGI